MMETDILDGDAGHKDARLKIEKFEFVPTLSESRRKV
jgi:hypothetical protein